MRASNSYAADGGGAGLNSLGRLDKQRRKTL